MTRKRSSPLGLEVLASLTLAVILLPLLAQAAPLQDATEIQQYTEGCYYNYNHYNEGDRILTNEPCLNCTCHNKMLMCYLRVCPFTKPIGHDCIVEKREDQCCPIITCPEVPVDVAHHAPEPGTELSIPEKYGCSIEEKFYPEGAQVPSNPNKPCELCYCIQNRTSCLMQECTLHIDGCTPIYNKGSCCPVRYNCDHENDVLELEDHSTTTTTVRPTPGFILTTTMSPSVTTDCIHNGELFADGASISGKTACEHCYCMRGDIVCAVQECEMPMTASTGKSCHALPAADGECCPSNYVCEDDTDTTQIIEATTPIYAGEMEKLTTLAPTKDIHSSIPDEDILLQEHIDEDQEQVTVSPDHIGDGKPSEPEDTGSGDFDATEPDMGIDLAHTTSAPTKADHDILDASSTSAPAVTGTTDEVKDEVVERVDAVTSAAPVTPAEDHLEVTTLKAEISEEASTEEKTDSEEDTDEDTTKIPFETRIDVTAGYSDIAEPTVKPEEAKEEPEPQDEHVEIGTSSEPAITEKDEHAIEAATTIASVLDKEESAYTEESITETSSEEDKDKIASSEPAITDKEDHEIETSTTIAAHVDMDENAQTEASVEESSSEEDTDKVTVSEPAVTEKAEKDSHVVEPSTTFPAIIDKDDTAHTESSTEATSSEEDKDESSSAPAPEKEDELVGSTDKPHVESTTAGQKDITTEDIEIEKEDSTPASIGPEIEKEDSTTAPIDPEIKKAVPTISSISPDMEKEDSTPASISSEIEKEASTPASISPEKPETSTTVADKEDTSSEETGSDSEEPASTESSEEEESSHKPTKSSEESTEHEDEITHKPTETADHEKPSTATVPSTADKDDGKDKESDEPAPQLPTSTPSEDQTTGEKTTVSPIAEDQKDDVTTVPSMDKKPTQDEAQQVVDESEFSTIAPIDSAAVGSTTSAPAHDETVAGEKEVPDMDTTVKPLSDIDEDVESASAAAPSDIDRTTIKPESSETLSEEVPEMQLPAVIPGEGDCLVGQKTYENNTIVPSSDECESSCRCISSVVVCEHIQCDIPENVEKCVLDEDSSNKCCPTYICGIDSAPAKPDTSSEDVEDEDITYTTPEAPYKPISEQTAPVDMEKPDETTDKLPSDKVDEESVTDVAPTDIVIPSVSTEEPMSHVKDETPITDADSVTIITRIDDTALATETPIVPDVAKPESATKPFQKPDEIEADDRHDEQSSEAPVSEVQPTLAEDDDKKKIAPQTPAPSADEIEEKPLDHTVGPMVDDDKKESSDETLGHTTSPTIEDIEKETAKPSVVEGEKKPTDIVTDKQESTGESLPQTTAPSVEDGEKEPIDETLAHTVIPSSTMAPSVDDVEKPEVDETLAHTIAPSVSQDTTESDADISSQTVAPSIQEDEKETLDEEFAHTISPLVPEIEKEDTDEAMAPIDGDLSTDKPEKAPIHDAMAHTESPSIDEDKKEHLDETLPETEDKKEPIEKVHAQTAEPAIDEDTATKLPSIEEGEKQTPIDEIVSHTTAAPTDEVEKHTTDEVSVPTIAPSIAEHEKEPTDEITESTAIEKGEDKPSDEIIPQTIAPATEEEVSSHTTTPSTTAGEEEPVDEVPTTEQETSDEIASVTVGPSIEQGEKTRIDESITPSSEDESDVDNFAPTIAPTTEKEKDGAEKEITSEKPSAQDVQEISTDTPLAPTGAPTEVQKDITDETSAQTDAPSVATSEKESVDDALAHTVAPSEDDYSSEDEKPHGIPDHTDSPAVDLTISEVEDGQKEVALDHTDVPTTEEDKQVSQTVSPLDAKKGEIEDTLAQTVAPIIEDGEKDHIATTEVSAVDESDKKPSTDVKGEKEPHDGAMAHTVAPDAVDDDKDEQIDTVTYTPTSTDKGDEEKPTDGTSTQTSIPSDEVITEKPIAEPTDVGASEEEKESSDEILPRTTVRPSIGETEKEPSDETTAQTDAPSTSHDTKQGVHDILDHITEPSVSDVDEFIATTMVPSVEDAIKESVDQTTAHTPVSPIEKDTTDEPQAHTVSPSTQEEEETKPSDEKDTSDESTEKTLPAIVVPSDEKEPSTEKGEEKKPIGETKPSDETTDKIVPTIGETDKEDVDESLAHTVAPAVTGDADETSTGITPTSQEGDIETSDEILEHTVPSDGDGQKEPLDHTTLPSVAMVEKDTADDVSTPTPMVGEEVSTENILAHTMAPLGEEVEKKPIDETYSHTLDISTEKQLIDDVVAQTTASSISDDLKATSDKSHVVSSTQETEKERPDDSLAPTVAPSHDEAEKEPIDEIVSPTVATTDAEIGTDGSMAHTTSPSIHDDEEKPSDEILAHTVAPVVEDTDDSQAQTDAPSVVDIEKKPMDDTLSQTTASSIEEDQKDITGEAVAHTVEPAVSEKEPNAEVLDHTISSLTEEADEKQTAATPSSPQDAETGTQTVSPLIEDGEKTRIDASTKAPLVDGTEKEPSDEIAAHTSAPAVQDGEKDTSDESGDHTDSPSIDAYEKETSDETVAQTAAPSVEDTEKAPTAPTSDEDGEHVSVDEDVSHTTASSETETKPSDEGISPTVAPSIKEGPKEPTDESVDHSPLPSVPSDEGLAHTTVSTIDTDDKSVAHTVPSSIGDFKKQDEQKPIDEDSSHTVAPSNEQDDKEPTDAHTAAPSAEDKEDVGEETTAPSAEMPIDKTDVHTSDAKIQPPSEPSVSEEPSDVDRTTIAPGTTDAPEDTVVQSIATPVDAEKAQPKPEPLDESETAGPSISDSTTIAPIVTAKPTHGTSVEASLDSTEDSDESMESEEEMTTEHKVQHIGEFVTERIAEGSTPEPSKMDSSEVSEDEDTATVLPPHPIDTGDHEAAVTDKPQLPGEAMVSPTMAPDTVPSAEDGEKAEDATTKPHIATEETPVETATDGAAPEISTQKTESEADHEKEENSDKHRDEDVAATTAQTPHTQHDSTPTTPSLDTRIDAGNATDDEALGATTAKDEEKDAATELPSTTVSTTTSSTTESPITAAAPAPQYPAPPGYGQPPHYPSYGEDEYPDEDESEVFGPGTCRYGGKLYVSAQQIPRDDPCDFCFCFRSDIICLQQSCPPPIAGCHEEPISGFCCPRYECPVSMATTLNITTSTTTTSTTLPPHFLHHSYGGAVQRNGCQINGRSYRVGEKIESTSGPCINCTCGGDGKMKCDPQACVPEPTMQQVMAVVAAGRKR